MTETESLPEAEVVLQRGAFYGSLARAFGPVEDYLVEGRALQELRSLDPPGPRVAACISKLPEGKGLEPDDLRTLTAERLRLFEKGECPPYESSYRSEKDPLKDVLMADVGGFYRALGLQPRGELPDHVVSELEFMGLLCLQEARAMLKLDGEAAELVREVERKFMSDHLGRWVERFRDAIQKEARVSLYPLLADLLVEFVGAEQYRLGAPSEERMTKAGDGSIAG